MEDPTLKQTVLTYQDETSLLEGVTTGDSHTTHFAWDDRGRLQSHPHPGGGTMTFVRAATPSGYSVEKTSPLGRLTTFTVVHDTANAELRQVATTQLGYDGEGDTTSVTPPGKPEHLLQFNATNQLASYENSAGVASAAFDGQDRIISSGDFEYDFTDNGELQKKTNLVSGEVTSYAYDAMGNLIQVTLPSGDVIEYLVDAMGRRVGKKVNGVLERQWLWRGKLQPVAQLDGTGNLVARFVYARGVNVPALMVTPSGTYRLVKDHLGSVRFVTSVAMGAVVQETRHDAWGRVSVVTNPGLQPFGFAGGPYDGETGLVRFDARDYDAEIGRWAAKDPCRFYGGRNLFQHADSDPTNLLDSTGMDPGGMSHGRSYRDFWNPPGGRFTVQPPSAEGTADSETDAVGGLPHVAACLPNDWLRRGRAAD